MIPDFSGDFLNFKSTTDGDIIEIVGEGKEEFNQILNKTIFNMQVRKGDKILTYSPSNKAGQALQKAFGKDSDDWVGKKFEVLHIDDKMAIRPLISEKVN